ncbi:hypothetical protein NDU88_001647 [Pleurodeles waltl]|uniref:Uncharacterized protein n=1 Tax=Pleurodeles waltl TaxID=8319 RepID=A0AAV7UUX5_PLEWA|nr:hypothetical protein NDU88_001647 [Pleurodeles waltl]
MVCTGKRNVFRTFSVMDDNVEAAAGFYQVTFRGVSVILIGADSTVTDGNNGAVVDRVFVDYDILIIKINGAREQKALLMLLSLTSLWLTVNVVLDNVALDSEMIVKSCKVALGFFVDGSDEDLGV